MNLEKLREKRKAKGITQEDMALDMGYRNKSSYSMLENGQVKFDADKMRIVKNRLELTDNEFFEIFLS